MTKGKSKGFDEWWKNLKQSNSIAAWMIHASLPEGVAWQIWNSVPKYEEIEKLKAENERLIMKNRKMESCAKMVMRKTLWPIDTPIEWIRYGCDEAYKMTDECLNGLDGE